MSVVISNRYWVCVYDELNREDIFNVRDDGTIEYGPNYTPEKAREAFSRQFGRPEGPPHFISGIEIDMNTPTEK